MKAAFLPVTLLATVALAGAQDLKKQIEASDQMLASAMKKKDFAAMNKIVRDEVTPDFVYTEEGKSMNAEKMLAEMKLGLSMMGKLEVVKARVISLKLKGNSATVEMDHMITGSMVDPKKKKTHTIDDEGKSTDTYVKVGGKWKMAKMLWGDSKMLVDGKPLPMMKPGAK